MIVWLRAATDSGELAIIIILTYFVALGEFTHIVAGAVEYLFLVFAALMTGLLSCVTTPYPYWPVISSVVWPSLRL